MTVVQLPDRTLVAVSGPDAEPLLQSIITTDLDALAERVAASGALLTPQGKILFDFLVSRAGPDAFLLECRSDIADDFIHRLMLYKLRAKVEIVKLDQLVVSVSWGGESAASDFDSAASETESRTVRDLRFPDEVAVRRHYGSGTKASGTTSDWSAFRAAYGIAESGADYALGDAFPHDVLLDELGGVGFRKGCYVGQEVVSRMQHRGTARRRVLLVSADQLLPAMGTEIMANGRSVGTLGTVAGSNGIAIARIDKVKDALDGGTPLFAGGVRVELSIPAWARFTFPQLAAGAEEA
jgi:tRNA-modifying protein YgfZ